MATLRIIHDTTNRVGSDRSKNLRRKEREAKRESADARRRVMLRDGYSTMSAAEWRELERKAGLR